MAKIVICIHGLGNKPPRDLLTKWWRESLQEGFKRIGESELLFKMEMVYWADILHPQPLDPSVSDKKSPLHITEHYMPAEFYVRKEPNKFRKKMLDYVEKQLDKLFLSESSSFDLTSISDLIIHKYFTDLETYYSSDCMSRLNDKCLARDMIRERLVDVLKKHKGKEILLIAHSMGAIISYDVLINPANNIKIDTLITIGSPLGIPIIMKKVAKEMGFDLNKGSNLKTPESITCEWLNFSDLHDKVAINYNLNDDYDPNSKGIAPEDFIVHNDYKVGEEENPHKSYGYLRTPELAEVVYEFLTRDKSKLYIWFNKKAASILERFY